MEGYFYFLFGDNYKPIEVAICLDRPEARDDVKHMVVYDLSTHSVASILEDTERLAMPTKVMEAIRSMVYLFLK